MSPSSIRVPNHLLEGAEKHDLPTLLASVEGMPAATARWEMRQLGLVQAALPQFRVVLLTDQPLFAEARVYGWPVEHFVAPVASDQLSGRAQVAQYRSERIAIAMRHYESAQLLKPGSRESLASAATRQLQLQNVPLEAEPPAPDTSTRRFATTEGSADVRMHHGTGSALFIRASSSHHPSSLMVPPTVSLAEITFEEASSIAFEAYVYSAVARDQGADVCVAQPWRDAATLLPNARYWIDLAVTADGEDGHLVVIPEYCDSYRRLTNAAVFQWEDAALYAKLRRISRDFSRRRGE